jgi:putative hemin transport protein
MTASPLPLETMTTHRPTYVQLRERQLAARAAARPPRTYDLARELDVSELSMALARLGDGVTLLRPDVDLLFARFEALGEVMGLTRNDGCVIEKHGHWAPFSRSGPAVGLVLDKGLDLRLFLHGFKHVLAVQVPNPRGSLDSIQCFDAAGRAVHKLFLLHATSKPAYEAIVADFAASQQVPPVPVLPWPVQPPESAAVPPGDTIDAFRDAWRGLRDTHDFFAMTRRFGVARQVALEIGPPELVRRTTNDAARMLLDHAVATRLPIMVFVGNDACIGIHTGPIARAMPLGDWLNVMDPDFNLHLSTSAIASTWVVKKPTADGLVTSIEIFDADRRLVVQFFGARKPGQPELEQWRDFVATLP